MTIIHDWTCPFVCERVIARTRRVRGHFFKQHERIVSHFVTFSFFFFFVCLFFVIKLFVCKNSQQIEVSVLINLKSHNVMKRPVSAPSTTETCNNIILKIPRYIHAVPHELE